MNRKALHVTALITAALLILSFAVCAFAEGGNGDGTGGGKDQPLTLVSSSIPNGSENVSTTPEIVLTFSKNVVNFTVKDNNEKCFKLTDSKGNNVPVDVIMGDDQVDPSIKRIITIKPKSPLTPGETYLLKIGGGITSKSGVSIGKDSYISFTVADDSSGKTTTKAPETTAKPVTTRAPATAAPVIVTTSTTTAKATTTVATTAASTTRRERATTTRRAKTTKAVSTTEATTAKPSTTKAATTAKTTTQKSTAAESTSAAVTVGVTFVTVSESVTETETLILQTEETEALTSEESEADTETADEVTEVESAKTNHTPVIIGAAVFAAVAAGAAALIIIKKKK